MKKAFIAATACLDKNKEEVNALNVFPVPDGDTGTNMSLTMKSSVKQILDLEEYSAGKVAMAASTGSLMGARGNSGVILSQLFRGFANGLNNMDVVNTVDLANAFKLAADTAYKAVMKPTEGTILTVARGCADYSVKIAKDEKDVVVFMEKVITHGNEVLNKTPEMLPVLKQAGVVDAGGKGLMYVLIGALNGITGKEEYTLEDLGEKKIAEKPVSHVHHDIDTADIKYGYCTEFMINTDNEEIDKFREEMAAFGDSLLVVGGEGIIKVHVHTNTPGDALQKALTLGELTDIKIDNMRYQHKHILAEEELNSKKKTESQKKYGFITVSIGKGLDTVFEDLNVDYIIPGGQTMNPSTEDILNAVDEVDAKNIIILPNNGNIVLAADQAKELSDKNIYVFPTKTIPQGISALLAFDGGLDVEENFKNMEEAIKHVKTAQVTYAVRDTEIDDIKIKKDDIIGIQKDDILSIGDNIQKVSFELIRKITDEDSSLITMFYGEETKKEDAMELAEKIEEEFDDFDIEVVYGGQPLYYYIFSIE